MSAHEPLDDISLGDHTFDRPHSIDLSLELEHQLNSESLPSSPTPAGRPQSLDPHVLASIIMQLRQSLGVVTKERDGLLDVRETTQSQEAELREALQHMTDRCAQLQDEVDEAKRKAKDDEDAINMLRTKVEESRRGLMRLQTENRRASNSPQPLDLARAGIPFSAGSNKRASFTPLTGSRLPQSNGHRRISSVSDSGLIVPDLGGRECPPTPGSQSFIFADNPPATPNHPPVSSRRFSGLFLASPPSEPSQLQDPYAEQIEALRRELRSVKDELDEARHELTEANEAREASETCVAALRAFIGEHNIGVHPPSAPPLKVPPAMSRGEDTGSAKSASGWGFKLWKVDPAKSASPASAAPAAPLAKLGGFFGSRTSTSSREPVSNGSDTSSIVESVAEPISPTAEVHNARVLVRGTGGSTSPDLLSLGSLQGMKHHLDKDGRVMADSTNVPT